MVFWAIADVMKKRLKANEKKRKCRILRCEWIRSQAKLMGDGQFQRVGSQSILTRVKGCDVQSSRPRCAIHKGGGNVRGARENEFPCGVVDVPGARLWGGQRQMRRGWIGKGLEDRAGQQGGTQVRG